MLTASAGESGGPEARVDDRPGRSRRFDVEAVLAGIIAALVLVPMVVSTAATYGIDWFPAGDWAILELRTRDVGTSATPLVGAYSRFGWNHPGPMLFWVLAVPARLAGHEAWGLFLGAALINLGAVTAMLWLAWRRAALAGVAIVGAGVSLLVSFLPSGYLWDPWNPWVTVIPFGLVVVATWAATDGDHVGLPIVAGVGSFLVQAHVGYGLLVVGLAAVAGLGAWRYRRGERWWLVPAIIAAALWAPVLVEQLFGGGNAGELASYFVGGSPDPSVGFATAVEIASRQLAGVAPWLGSGEPVNPMGGGVEGRSVSALAVSAAVFAGAAALAWWRGAAQALRLQGVVLVAVVLGIVSVARMSGQPFDYLLRWWWVLAMLGWVSVALSVWSSLPRRFAPPALVAALALLVVVPATIRSIERVDRAAVPAEALSSTIRAIVDPTVAAAGDDTVTLSGTGPRVGWLVDSMADELLRYDIDVRTDPAQATKFGEHRSYRSLSDHRQVILAAGPQAFSLDARADLELVARWEPPGANQQERAAIEAELSAQLTAAGRQDLIPTMLDGNGLGVDPGDLGLDPDLMRRWEDMRRAGYPVAVFIEAPRS